MLSKRRGIIPTMAYIDPDPDHGPGRDAVELYTRTYGTLLRSSGETKLKVLEQSHIGMESSLHPTAGSAEPDTGRSSGRCLQAAPRCRRGEMGDAERAGAAPPLLLRRQGNARRVHRQP